jgi:membrane-bound lytic murein transglycosylase MltF
MGVEDPFDPAQNIAGGVKYLASLIKRFEGNTSLAVAAYNAGPGAVDKYKGIPPYRETQQYVQRVLGYTQSLSQMANTVVKAPAAAAAGSAVSVAPTLAALRPVEATALLWQASSPQESGLAGF